MKKMVIMFWVTVKLETIVLKLKGFDVEWYNYFNRAVDGDDDELGDGQQLLHREPSPQ